MLMDFSGCDTVELWAKERSRLFRCVATGHRKTFRYESIPATDRRRHPSGRRAAIAQLSDLCIAILNGDVSFRAGNAERGISYRLIHAKRATARRVIPDPGIKSYILLPIKTEERVTGILHLASRRKGFFVRDDRDCYEDIARTLGDALAHRQTGVALRERLKELRCLYGIAQLAARPDLSLDVVLQSVVELLPPAWLYPEVATAKLILDGRAYASASVQEGRSRQVTVIEVGGVVRGSIEVVYSVEKLDLDEGPFLKEERRLLETIARDVGMIVEKRQSDDEKLRLQEQLRHADRLATIGQLAAGVAHELNEPLESIIGFSQLAKKSEGLSQQAEKDVDRIVNAALHAREVIKKLMMFARQRTPEKSHVNLNRVVEEGMYFLESRCARNGVELVRLLAPSIPETTADPVQIHQTLVNLVVNAIQAMPLGGRLTLRTLAGERYVSLVVEDTGIGMDQEALKKIFTPFYTTKEANEGTGLGLSVVHGIVAAHGGSIHVESEPGKGTRFEIRFPVNAEHVEEREGLYETAH